MVGAGERCLLPEADHQPRPVTSKLLAQRHAGLEGIEQAAVGEIERDAGRDAQKLGSFACLFQSHVGSWRTGRRFAVGEIDNPHLVPLPGEAGDRASAGDLHVVRVRADRDHVEFRVFCFHVAGRGI